MAVRIRMKRLGRKHRPYYRIVAIDSRQPRDGRVLEELGTYDPQVKDLDKSVTLKPDRVRYWLSVGVAGEPWFQSLEKIEHKYNPAGEEVRAFRFDARPMRYRIFKPKAATRNWAAGVSGPGITGFFIRPHYDPTRPLYSPAGGFVVRDDAPDPYQARPDDVWLVQKDLFDSTYELLP